MNTLLITFTLVLPLITFLLGTMYGGHEARKESRFTHTNPVINRTQRELRAQKN